MPPPVLIESPLPNKTYRGKVRDTYDLGERSADRRDGPHLRLRRRPADRHSGQGQGAQPDVGMVVRPHEGRRAEPLSSVWPTAARLTNCPSQLPPELIGRSSIVKKATPHRRRVHRARLPRGLRMGGVQAVRHRQRRADGEGAASKVSSCRSRCSRRRRRRTRATTSR